MVMQIVAFIFGLFGHQGVTGEEQTFPGEPGEFMLEGGLGQSTTGLSLLSKDSQAWQK